MTNNAMTGFTPIWEGLITDGSFQPKELLKRVQNDLKTKHQAAKYKAMPTVKGKSVVLQFRNPDTGKQVNKGCGGCRFDLKGVQEAAEKADRVTQALNNQSFSWDWYETVIQGNPITTKEKERRKEEKEKEEENKTVGELFAAYKKYWFDEDKRSKKPRKNAARSWENYYRWLDKIFLNYNKKLSNALIIECINKTQKDSETRTKTLNSLRNFLEWCDKWDEYSKLIEKYKKENKPVKQERNIPNDKKIEYIFEQGFIPSKKGGNPQYHYRFPQWQFFYALLAVYGIRIHEAWNIKNWDKPVVLGKGDWVEIEEYTDNIKDIEKENVKSKIIQMEEEIVIPAILDPTNKEKRLAIGHNTKTGYRLAYPLSPENKNWFEQFGLNQPMNLPDVKNPLEYMGQGASYNCTGQATGWFNRKQYGFTPHDLRHAWNIRGHIQGKSPTALANSLGHKLDTNTKTYLRMSINRKIENMDNAFGKVKKEQSELEKLKEQVQQKDKKIIELEKEVIQLKTAIQFKDEEIERLRTELMMMKAVQS